MQKKNSGDRLFSDNQLGKMRKKSTFTMGAITVTDAYLFNINLTEGKYKKEEGNINIGAFSRLKELDLDIHCAHLHWRGL